MLIHEKKKSLSLKTVCLPVWLSLSGEASEEVFFVVVVFFPVIHPSIHLSHVQFSFKGVLKCSCH